MSELPQPYPYTPSGSFTTSITSNLSHDTITAATIPVYNASLNPLAAFVNPNTGFTEALVVSVDSNDNPVVAHITRSASSPSGWTLSDPIAPNALEVAAGTAYSGMQGGPAGTNQVYGFYHDGTSLYGMQLNVDTWSTPAALGDAITGLKVAYSPGGVMVLYAQGSDGSLVTYWQQGGWGTPFVAQDWNLPVSSDVQLILNDGTTGTNWQAASIANGAITVAQGVFPATGTPEPSEVETVVTAGAAQIVMGFWSTEVQSASFLYLDTSGNINNYCGVSLPIVTTQNPTIVAAAGFLQNTADGNPTLHLYSVDAGGTLWVLHQDPITPWNYENKTPNFTPFLQLAANVGNVVSDMNPADAPTLFVVDKGEITERSNSVRMHRQDPLTNYWFSDNMFMPALETFDVVRFRTQVSLFDANGVACPNYPLALSVPVGGTSVEVAVGGQSYFVAGGTSTAPAPTVPVTTDIHGRLTLAVMASSGLSTPPLLVTGTDAAGTAFTLSVEANRPIHDYLAGNGKLNPTNPGGGLPVFDAAGTTLKAATDATGASIIDPAKLTYVPTVAAGLQQLGQKAIGTSASELVGFTIDFSDCANPTYTAFTDRAAFDAHVLGLSVDVGGIFSWLSSFAEDVYSAVENAVLKVVSVTIDAINNVVSLVVNEFKTIIKLTVKGLEDIAHAVASVFMWVVDEIKMVIDWLKALFDLKAIWRTKTQFQSAIQSLIGDGTSPGYIVQTLASNAGQANGWFTQQQAQIDAIFQALIASYDPNATFAAQPGFAAPGAPSSAPIGGGSVSPSDCTNNVHHNWLHDKMASGAPAGSPGANDGTLTQTWSDFVTSLGASGTDFMNAFGSFAAALQTVIENPAAIASTGIADFLTGVQQIIDGLLQLADAIVQGLATMAEGVMASIATLLNTPIDIPFLQVIWDWVSGGSDPLTILSVISLLAAFPTTLVYILMTGSEPFPDSMMAMESGTGELPVAAAIMQILSVIPLGISLALGAACPWYITLFNFVVAGLIFFFSGGMKDFQSLQWSSTGDQASNILWIGPAAAMIVTGMAAAQQQTATWALGDIAKVVETVIGMVTLVFAAIAAAPATAPVPPPSAGDTAGHILTSLPNVFATLQTSVLRDGPYGGYASAVAGALLAVGCIGGGSAELLAAVD